MPSTMKVSVIVPTYCSGERLMNVVDSIDCQSLPQSEFEVLFVDDGSPDDTMRQLHQIASTRPNVRVLQIPHSGWPSKARNEGLRKARGEYVLFMDHDDELYRDALQSGYQFAHENRADVLNGKEARTDQPKWGLETYTGDYANSIHRSDVHPLIPTNPHKLFRREFLIEHGITFPEGRRVLWEDVHFNLDVSKHAKRIATLSSVPFYHWVQHGENTSRSFRDDPVAYWKALARVFEATSECLASPQLADQLELMLAYQYRTRFLPALGPSLWGNDTSIIKSVIAIASEILTAHVPHKYDCSLSKYGQARAYLLREGKIKELAKLVHVDAGMTGISMCVDAAWHRHELEVRSITRWKTATGQPLSLVLSPDGRIMRNLPHEVNGELPANLVDVTDDVENASTQIGLKSRRTKITWLIPTTHRVEVLGTHNGPAEVTVKSTGALNVTDTVFGKALPSDVWDFNARNILFDVVNHRALRTRKVTAPSIRQHRALQAYANQNRFLSFDMDQRIHSIAIPDCKSSLHVAWRGWKKIELSIPLKKLSLDRTNLECYVKLGSSSPVQAIIENRGKGNRLYVEIPSAPGRYALAVGSMKKQHNTGATIVIRTHGRVHFA